MAATPTIHVVTNAELAAGRELEGLADPERIAPIAPAKRSALLANPYLRGGEDAARLLASVDSRIGGRLDLVAGEIETPDGPVPLFWGSSFYVSPHLRGRGIGSALLRAAEEWRPSAGAAGPSRLSKPLYLRRGYYDVPLRRHVLVRRSRSLVRRWLGSGAPARAVETVADAAAGGHRALLAAMRKTRAGRLAAEPCDAFPQELETRLPRAVAAPFATPRSAAWLDWVVHESFGGEGGQRRALRLVRDDAGALVAYYVVKARTYSGVTRWNLEGLELGSLVDWAILEPGAASLEQIVLLALDTLDEWGVAAVEVCLPPDASGMHLGRWGFLGAGVQHILVRGGPGTALARPEARAPERWRVRPGDGDYVFS